MYYFHHIWLCCPFLQRYNVMTFIKYREANCRPSSIQCFKVEGSKTIRAYCFHDYQNSLKNETQINHSQPLNLRDDISKLTTHPLQLWNTKENEVFFRKFSENEVRQAKMQKFVLICIRKFKKMLAFTKSIKSLDASLNQNFMSYGL